MTSTTPSLFDPLPNLIPGPVDNPNDQGECLALDAETVTRCDGRMIVHYETLHGQIGYPVWTCQKCGKVVIP